MNQQRTGDWRLFRLLGTLKGYVSSIIGHFERQHVLDLPSTPQNLLRKNPHSQKNTPKRTCLANQASSNINWDVIPKVNVDRPLRICFDLKHTGYQSKSHAPPLPPAHHPPTKSAQGLYSYETQKNNNPSYPWKYNILFYFQPPKI